MKLQVLISGAGTTLKNLIEHFPHQIIRVVADRQCEGLKYAKTNEIDFRIIEKKNYINDEAWSKALLDCDADLHILAGFLSKVYVSPEYIGKIINIHPSINPNYAGKGWYGLRVQQAVVENKDKRAGCMIHTIDNEYDKGTMIRESSFPLTGDETAEEVMLKVQELERKIFPETIQEYFCCFA